MATALYAVADVHLGEGRGSPAFLAFLDRLAGEPPSHLVILGDLFAYWVEDEALLQEFAPWFQRLRHLVRHGWRIDLIAGNREMAAGRMLAAACRATVHRRRLVVTIGQRRLRLEHGDQWTHDRFHRLLVAMMNGSWAAAVQGAMPPFLRHLVARSMRRFSRGRSWYRLPEGAIRELRVRMSVRLLHRVLSGVDAVLAGHLHRPWHGHLAGTELVLLGTWLDGVPRWVEVGSAGQVRICHDLDAISIPAARPS